jgi:hypothetical protein
MPHGSGFTLFQRVTVEVTFIVTTEIVAPNELVTTVADLVLAERCFTYRVKRIISPLERLD